MIQSKDETRWSGIAFHVFVNTITHPIEYAKILMQIGYEPIPPRPTTTLFRKPALALPNVFQYVRYIKNVDGFTGCYRGLIPKLCVHALNTIVIDKTAKSIKFDDEEEDEDDSPKCKQCVRETIKSVVSVIVGIVVSQPLDVIAVRMMAQFVGGETKYNGLFRSFLEVYKENGIFGFYAGIVPRLIGNTAAIVLSNTATYVIHKYILNDRDITHYTSSIVQFMATLMTYPFLVVSHCMIVNNCGLVAGLPPQMPIYNSWLDCWSHLSATNQLKRGTSLIWRYYTGPNDPRKFNIQIKKDNLYL